MKLWSIQPEVVVQGLLDGKPYRPDGRRLEYHFFRERYRWMIQQLRERVPGYRKGYPVWAWADPKPDLRKYRHIKGKHALLHLEVAPERVLLSDFEMWNQVLNGAPLFTQPGESEAHYARWDEAALAGKSAAEAFDEYERDMAPATWPHIFDLPLMRKVAEECEGQVDYKQEVQACFEEIRPEDVKRVRWFGQ